MSFLQHLKFAIRQARIARTVLGSTNQEPLVDGLTRSASKRLRRLEKKGFRLALGLLAHDVRHSVAAAVDLHRRGDVEGADFELFALRVRIHVGWAFSQFGFPLGRIQCDFHSIAAPLEIGLGMELSNWLFRPEGVDMTAAQQWLEAYAPVLDAFTRYVMGDKPERR